MPKSNRAFLRNREPNKRKDETNKGVQHKRYFLPSAIFSHNALLVDNSVWLEYLNQ